MSVIVRRLVVILGVLVMAAPAWAQSPAASAFQGFSVVLVLGDVQEGVASDSIPAAARAALADLKDFLPYRSYRVLDTAWVLASSQTRQAVTSRLQGADEQDYEVTLDRVPVGPSSLQVRFMMREPDGNAERRAALADRERGLKGELDQLLAARVALESQLKRLDAAHPDAAAARQRIADIEVRAAVLQNQIRSSAGFGGATLIDTSFNMSLGETVVVGTSRMRGGNKALIVLLTAATRGAKPKE